MKKATATSHGNNRFTDSPGAMGGAETTLELAGTILVTDSIAGLGELANNTSAPDLLKTLTLFHSGRQFNGLAVNHEHPFAMMMDGARIFL
jgi:hypothetical protein